MLFTCIAYELRLATTATKIITRNVIPMTTHAQPQSGSETNLGALKAVGVATIRRFEDTGVYIDSMCSSATRKWSRRRSA